MSKLNFLLFFLSIPLSVLLYIWKQTKRPVFYMRWVLSPIWMSMLLLYGEHALIYNNLAATLPLCIIITIVLIALRSFRKANWKWRWTLCPIWFWMILNLGAFLHLISINYLEPRGLPF